MDLILLKACLKGLIDTDGGIYNHNQKSLQICFYNSSLTLINSVYKAFIILGFKPFLYKKKDGKCVISISGKDAIKYIDKIGFSNQKNLFKSEYYKQFGIVPLNSIVEKYLFFD